MNFESSQAWAQQFRQFAALECLQDPLYVAICQAVADAPELLALMAHAPPTQAIPNLLLAALHERVLAGVAHPLADYYPSVGGQRLPDAQLPALLLDFARQQQASLIESLRERRTQTNEIGRCAVLWPALQHIAGLSGSRSRVLSLIDFGCSAGLNLGVDRYCYRYQTESGAGFVRGAPVGPERPEIVCDWLGVAAAPPAEQAWQLQQRLGLDLAPLDVQDPAALRWLHACLWPHERERARRLDQAVALVDQHRVQQSEDGLSVLEAQLAAGDFAGSQPVLFNSWVLYYFTPAALQHYQARVRRLVLQHGLIWLSAEGAALRPPGLDLPPLSAERAGASATLWTLQWAANGQIQQQALAWSHPHGRWLAWCA